MDELREEYTLLFNGISDTIVQLEKTIKRLQALQQRAEEAYISEDGAAPETNPGKDVPDGGRAVHL